MTRYVSEHQPADQGAGVKHRRIGNRDEQLSLGIGAAPPHRYRRNAVSKRGDAARKERTWPDDHAAELHSTTHKPTPRNLRARDEDAAKERVQHA